VHFLQIWLLPAEQGIAPSYEQKTFSPDEQPGQLRLVASADGRDGSLTLHTDASFFAGRLDSEDRIELPIANGRHAWVQVARGRVTLNGRELGEGDGAALSDEAAVRLSARAPSEVLVFDLA
jgi:redox-sensitive bicupin YhaK (pirin superfamily)